MIRISLNRALAAAVVGLTLVVLALTLPTRQAAGRTEEGGGAAGPAHYTVVITEGHNLLVTDNAANKIYFYTKDYDKPMGSPLKLRADLDLTQVGKPEITITPHNLEKFIPPEEKEKK
jgi:hypothetical protein